MPARKKRLGPRKKPVQDRSQETVQVILKATTRILIRDGLGGLTTNAVARQAGVSIGSLYQYFPNKESLLSALVEQKLYDDKAYFEARLEGFESWSLEEKFLKLIESGIELHRRDSKILKVMFEQLGGTGQMDLVKEMNMTLFRMIHGMILFHGGRKPDPKRAEHLAYLHFNLILSIWHSQVEKEWQQLDSRELAGTATGMILQTLAD